MEKQEIIAKYATKEGDTGSPEVQIALLTERINHLNEHLNIFWILHLRLLQHLMKFLPLYQRYRHKIYQAFKPCKYYRAHSFFEIGR